MSDPTVAKRLTECEHVHGLEEFQQLAARTAPKDYGIIQTRLARFDEIKELYSVLGAMVQVSKRVDALKKKLFYGKPYPADHIAGLPVFDCSDAEQAGWVIDRNTVPVLRLIHAVLGLGSESGEVAEKLKSVLFDNSDIDVLSWLKEFGDSGWYLMEGCTALNESSADMATVVIGKLRDRYPEAFDETKAQNHNGE